MKIKKINPDQLYQIRHQVLRPHQSLDDCKYPGDFESDSFHLGFYDPDLVSIASFYKQKNDHFIESKQYRLRGMATLPDFRGKGLAGQLLQQSMKQLQTLNADLLWCNARVSAEAFYIKLGFEKIGDQFDIESIGPHYVYFKKLNT